MAGSSTSILYDDGQDRVGQHCNVKRIVFDWVSDDTTGAVSGTTGKIVGELIKAVTDPSDSAAPTDNYDIALTGGLGDNLLADSVSNLTNRDTSSVEVAYLNLSDGGASPLKLSAFPVVCDAITVAVTNAGNSKAGRLVLYYRPL